MDFASDLNEYSNALMPFIIMLQCFWTIWVYSNPYFFTDDASTASKQALITNIWELIMKLTTLETLSNLFNEDNQGTLFYMRTIPFILIVMALIF